MSVRFNWSGAVQCLLAAAARLGVPQAEVLKAARVDPADLPPVSGRMSWGTTAAITQAALELTQEPALGLLAGSHCALEMVGLPGLYYMHVSPARASQRVAYEEVWPRLTNILRFWHEAAGPLTLHCGENLPPHEPYFEDHLHLQFGLHLSAYRALFGEQIEIDHISLRSRAVGDPERLSALFKCRVLTGQPRDWVAVPHHVADRPMPLALPWLREQLRPQLDAFLLSLDEERVSTVAVGDVLQNALLAGQVTALESVAARLGWNPRTLRARLASEGTSFTEILDTKRKEYALRQMSFPGVKLAVVAVELGFSDQASFTRAFRRWTGRTPSEWMESRAGTDGRPSNPILLSN